MLTVVRHSQIHGLTAIDGATVASLGEIEAVWLDDTGRVAYLSGREGFLPLDQVADISQQALSTCGRVLVAAPDHVQSLHELRVQSFWGDLLGWVDDFLFDWRTGEIAAYVLAGRSVEPLGEHAVFYPDDVEELTPDYLRLKENAYADLKPESEGLQAFLSEQPESVQQMVAIMRHRLYPLLLPQDGPDAVKVKVNGAGDELAASGEHDRSALQAATALLHEQWENLRHSLGRSGQRARAALASARQHLWGRPPA
ncbi:photosystem reaction center subunit H [Nodosilinea sp. PGN35]|uniref:photosystem reaction center subunit H n=1 Tax=Nodosilinea sp. PGN35 TaxID=3020489 RepID=UPI00398B9C78